MINKKIGLKLIKSYLIHILIRKELTMLVKTFKNCLILFKNRIIKIITEQHQMDMIKRNIDILGSYKTVPKIEQKNYTEFTWNTHLGKHCIFNGMIIRGNGRVTIGDNFHSGSEILLLTSIHNYEGETLPYDRKSINKDITIKNNVWIGQRVIVLGGAKIGEGAIIQAGSVVIGEIPKYAIAGGHPAKPFAYRDKERYERLKKEGKILFLSDKNFFRNYNKNYPKSSRVL